MSIARGDHVRVAYVGRFEDGTVFAASSTAFAERGEPAPPAERSPLSFTVGEGEVIAGLEEGVVGLEPGDTATFTVPPEDGYGTYDPEKRREYEREAFEAMVGEPPEVGLHVEAQNDLHGDVTAVTDDHVQVDFNHELAGKPLRFEVQVL
ncbi:MAG: peptidylprolyl isomerase [Halolamina sp.]